MSTSNTASENEKLTFGQAADHTLSLQASTKSNTQSVDDLAGSPVMKTHKPDVGNTMLLGIFLVESMSKDSVGTELGVHGGIEVRDDKNTKHPH